MTKLVPDHVASHADACRHIVPARKPDFFIVGAPKAGTTSLYAYLSAHPRIFMPSIKEPFFFCSDVPGYREKVTLITDTAKYLQLFAKAGSQHLVCGEASPLYLCSKLAVPRILEFNSAARFIVVLRNPVELAYSLHSQLVRVSSETVHDFEEAWRLQKERAMGRHVPDACIDPTVLQYRRVSSLGEQLARLFTHVSHERVMVFTLDDLAADPKRIYENVLAFLDVPSDQRTEFPHENPNQVPRSSTVGRLVKSPPFPLSLLRDQYRRRFGVGTWPARVLQRLNSRPAPRAPLSPRFRRELEAEFHDEVRLLECLVDRDLAHWIAPRTGVRRSVGRVA